MPRPSGRAARNGILVATAALSLACGGTISSDDGGKADAVADHASDQSNLDDSSFIIQDDATADAAPADASHEDVYWPPPPPYGSPPIPHRRVV